MAPVAAELHAGEGGVRLVQLGDERPGAVGGAIVHEKHAAVRCNGAGIGQGRQLVLEPPGGFRQHRFFLVAGHDDI